MAVLDPQRGEQELAQLSAEDQVLARAITEYIDQHYGKGGALTPLEAAIAAVRVTRERQ